MRMTSCRVPYFFASTLLDDVNDDLVALGLVELIQLLLELIDLVAILVSLLWNDDKE